MAVTEDLELNISRALASVREITEAFERGADEFISTLVSGLGGPVTQAVSEAIAGGVTSGAETELELDTEPVEESVSSAIEAGASTEAVVEDVDAEAVASTVTEAVDEGAATPVLVDDVDAETVAAAIEESAEAADTAVAIAEPDAGLVIATIEAAADQADTAIEIDEPDASAVTESIEEAVEAIGGAEGAVEGLAGTSRKSVGDISNDIGTVISGATDLTAALGGAGAGLGGLAAKAGPAGAALAAVAGATTLFVSGAIETIDVNERFGRTFGTLAGQIEQIDIGGLNISIADLAVKLGASDDAIRQNAVQLGILGQAAGLPREQVAATTEQIIALAAGASALNPTLGTTDQVMAGLSNALATGGRRLASYGINLSAAEIQQQALADTGKESTAELTQYELAAAGAALATARFGDTLGTAVEEGSQAVAVQLRSAKVAIGETIEALGLPLVAPVVAAIKSVMPLVTSVATIIGNALRVVIPIVSSLVSGFSPLSVILKIVAGVTGFLADVVEIAFGLFRKLGAFIADKLGPVFEFFADKLGPIVDLFKIVSGFISTAWQELKTFAGVTDAGADALEAGQEQADEFAVSMDGVGESVAGAAEELPTFAEQVKATADAVVESAPSISAVFAKVSEDTQVSLMELQVAFLEQLKAENAFFDNVVAIADAGGKTLAEELLSQGPERGAAIAAAIAASAPAQIKALEDQANELVGAERAAGERVGRALAEGINEGIKVNFTLLRGTMRNVSRILTNDLERRMEVQSPSKVFARIGEELTEGLAIGILDGIPAVRLAAVELAGAATPGPLSARFGPGALAGAGAGTTITNNWNLPPLEDPQALAIAIDQRQGMMARR